MKNLRLAGRFPFPLLLIFSLQLLISCNHGASSGDSMLSTSTAAEFVDQPPPTPTAVEAVEPSPSTSTSVEMAYLPFVQKPPRRMDCEKSSFGTMLISTDADGGMSPADVLLYANDELGVKGMVGAGAPSDEVRDAWFEKLPGWTRSFMRGSYAQLVNIHAAAKVFGMEDMYECFGYGPESVHAAGEEALRPREWVPQAEVLAESAGKCLIYGPAVRDYEYMAELERLPDPSSIVADSAPHVDIWMIQLAKYQNWVDTGRDEEGNPYTLEDFRLWIAHWVSWIKGANPAAQVWTQLGIGKWDPLQKACLAPQPPDYILKYREVLTEAGVDGVWVMPAQPCQPCPPDPPPNFLCSTDPQDHVYYRASLDTFKQAIEMACGQ